MRCLKANAAERPSAADILATLLEYQKLKNFVRLLCFAMSELVDWLQGPPSVTLLSIDEGNAKASSESIRKVCYFCCSDR
jgi:hypothetical protein